MSPSINTTPSDAPNPSDTNDTPGRRLRTLRESRKLDIERVAAQLHLQRHVVEAIEGDHYERLPAPVFVVGYLKNYARLLGADPTPIIAAYRHLVPAREISLGPALSDPNESSTGSGRWIWFVGILLVGAAAGMATFWLRGQNDPGLQSDRPAPSGDVTDPASIAAPATIRDASKVAANSATTPSSETGSTISAPPESIPLRQTETQPLAGTKTTPAASVAAGETLVAANTLVGVASTSAATDESDAQRDARDVAETAPEPEVPAPEPASSEVVLEFTGTSWIDVRGTNGSVVLNGEMRSGDRRVLDGEPPYKFVIGNASATRLTVGGRPFDLQSRARGNVARFSLDPSSIE